MKTVLRSIVPNTDPRVYLLRIGVDFVERVPVVAWDVHVTSQHMPKAGVDEDSYEAVPISIEDCASNLIQCIVHSNGTVLRPWLQSWESEADAIAECQQDLRDDQAAQ